MVLHVQRLLELEVESTVHQQRAEEAERLARDWELQLERAAEQKHSTKRGNGCSLRLVALPCLPLWAQPGQGSIRPLPGAGELAPGLPCPV